MKVAVVIPALNEAGCIAELVAETLAQPAVNRVIVVDNGSTDGTGEIARRAGASVVREPRRGYGYAWAAGIAEAHEADVIVFLDGDFSYRPDQIPALLAPLREGRADMVLGSRALGKVAKGAMPLQQRFGDWLGARLMQLFYGTRLTDLGPLRAVRRDLILALDLREMTYGYPTEMNVKAARTGARIVEVPVGFYPRRAGKSKISGTLRGTLLAGYYITTVTLKNISWKPDDPSRRKSPD